MMTWDESKRLENLRKHGLDFVGCEAVFDSPVVTWEDDREAYGEQRINLLGWLAGRLVHLTYTDRGEQFQVISLLYQARQNYLRQQITIQKELEAALQEKDVAQQREAAALQEKDAAQQREAAALQEKDAALAEIERLKALLRN